jgi:hypothetical protein
VKENRAVPQVIVVGGGDSPAEVNNSWRYALDPKPANAINLSLITLNIMQCRLWLDLERMTHEGFFAYASRPASNEE